MKFTNVEFLGFGLMVSAMGPLPVMANPGNLIPIWGAVPSNTPDTVAHQNSGIEEPVTCSNLTRGRDNRIVRLIALSSVDFDRVGGYVNQSNDQVSGPVLEYAS